jgi:hypothetical protein
MLECNLSGHRVLSLGEVYHKRREEGTGFPIVSSSSTKNMGLPLEFASLLPDQHNGSRQFKCW